jgi:hypothetical protein
LRNWVGSLSERSQSLPPLELKERADAFIGPGHPCKPVHPRTDDLGMNPHSAVKPPGDRARDFAEILEDWDSHCHDRLLLDHDGFHTPVLVVLLDTAAQAQFQASRSHNKAKGEAGRYEGAPALYGFSRIFFNQHHTVALVYATYYCGNICAGGFWVRLALTHGRWEQLGWDSSRWIS